MDNLRKNALKAKKYCTLLSNKNVINILTFLENNENSDVTTLYKSLKMEQSVMSQFLNKLKYFGIVSCHRDGRRIIYSLHKNFEWIEQRLEILIIK